MKLPETIYTARVIGNYVYEWTKEDGLLRRRTRNTSGPAKVVGYSVTPSRVDKEIQMDFMR